MGTFKTCDKVLRLGLAPLAAVCGLKLALFSNLDIDLVLYLVEWDRSIDGRRSHIWDWDVKVTTADEFIFNYHKLVLQCAQNFTRYPAEYCAENIKQRLIWLWLYDFLVTSVCQFSVPLIYQNTCKMQKLSSSLCIFNTLYTPLFQNQRGLLLLQQLYIASNQFTAAGKQSNSPGLISLHVPRSDTLLVQTYLQTINFFFALGFMPSGSWSWS